MPVSDERIAPVRVFFYRIGNYRFLFDKKGVQRVHPSPQNINVCIMFCKNEKTRSSAEYARKRFLGIRENKALPVGKNNLKMPEIEQIF